MDVFLVDFLATGGVTLKIASLTTTPLNMAPIVMTKVEGGFIATLPVLPPGRYALRYQGTVDADEIDVNELLDTSTTLQDAIAAAVSDQLESDGFKPASVATVANAVQLALNPQLSAIAADALLGALPVGNSEIDEATADCVFSRNGVEIRRLRQEDENGNPNPIRVFKTTVI
jgi:hypothetical protein